MSKKRNEWDYSLHIKGVTKDSLGLLRLAEYLKAFAQLLGEDAKPKFAGIVNGSAVLRARDDGDQPEKTRMRISTAAQLKDAPGHAYYAQIERMMAENSARGEILDKNKVVLLRFETAAANDDPRDVIIHDESELDGIIVGITGSDDTAHVKLQIAPKIIYNISVRDMGLAKKLATKFRGETIRLHVHGTWKRKFDGTWLPHSLYADKIEDLDQRSVDEVLKEMLSIPNNGWSEMKDSIGYWKDIRGLNDHSN